jgi:outer membrane protein assembly factor BamB
MNPASQIIRSTSALLTVWAMLIPASTAKAAPAGGLDAWQALAEAARQRSPGLTVVVGHCRPGDVRGLAEGFTGPIQLLVEPDRLAVQRKALAALEPAGRVTAAMHRPGSPLPYVQGLVNRLVLLPGAEVSDDQARRVLSPGGERIAVTGDDGVDIERIETPEELDVWTHYLHSASGNPVAADRRVAPPVGVRWIAPPRWSRSHETNSSIGAAVTDGRRLYYAVDEGLTGVSHDAIPSRWHLAARDAHSGVLHWKRPVEWGLERWGGGQSLWRLPDALPRCLVVGADRLYVTTEYAGPLRALDCATGRTSRTYEATDGTREVLLTNGLLVVTGAGKSDKQWLAVLDADSGRTLWRHEGRVVTLSPATDGESLCWHDGESVRCAALRTGRHRWQTPAKLLSGWPATGTLVLHDRWAYFCGGKGFRALDLADGSIAWQRDGKMRGPFRHPPEVFVADGLVWFGKPGGEQTGHDPATGEVKRTLRVPALITRGHHYRCYRTKATERFLIFGKRGAEFLDLRGDEHMRHDWFRGACKYGILPANGLVYAPPHPCFCYPGVKLKGFYALHGQSTGPAGDLQGADAQGGSASTDEATARAPAGARLARGPAWCGPEPRTSPRPGRDDWPTYRRDERRSGWARCEAPEALTERWSTKVAAPASAPVVAEGRVLLAETDAHRVRCFDANTGEALWSRVLAGRVDSPPTVYQGRVLVGDADGRVHCLRLSDGEAIWTFRAAPRDRRIVSYGQLESTWPTHGSVLVQNRTAYVAAGRSTHMDGGIWLWALDPRTGEVRHRALARSPRPDVHRDRSRAYDMEGAENQLLVGDGSNVYLSQMQFDESLQPAQQKRLSHMGDLKTPLRLMATGGFLDGDLFNRTYWAYWRRWPGFYFANQAPKSGQLVVFNDRFAFAAKIFRVRDGLSPQHIPGQTGTLVFADEIGNEPILVGEKPGLAPMQWIEPAQSKRGKFDNKAVNVNKGTGYTRQDPPQWKRKVDLIVRAMAGAGERLLVAGPPDEVADGAEPEAILRGAKGARLLVLDALTGEVLAERALASMPVFDGLIVARRRVYFTAVDGTLVCLGKGT